jgi:hypothetical protein
LENDTVKEMKEILKLLIDDLEKNTVAIAFLAGKAQGADAQTLAEMIKGHNAEHYKSLRNRVDALK